MISLAQKLATVRAGVSFAECLDQCAGDSNLLREYDRLRGTNLSLNGNPIDRAIDLACGRLEAELPGFIDFCWDVIFLRFG